MKDLNGRVAFITGGGGGIGCGMAQAFAERGMKLILADIDRDHAQAQAAAFGRDAIAVPLDVTSPESWAAACRTAQARFGDVDVLCNNAGIAQTRVTLDEVPSETFARIMAVNLTGIYNGIKAFVPAFRARGSGHIVNTSSMNGLLAHGTFAAYTASKFAVTGLSEALQQELAPHNVGVSILFPGLTRSRMSLSPIFGPQLNEIAATDLRARMMDPLWVGRAVVRAVEANDLYIISHPEHGAVLRERYANVMAAFGAPAQPGFGDAAPAAAARCRDRMRNPRRQPLGR